MIALASDRAVTVSDVKTIGQCKIFRLGADYAAWCGSCEGIAKAVGWIGRHPADYAGASKRGKVGSLVITGTPARLLDIEWTGAVEEVSPGQYSASGSGKPFALGAMFARPVSRSPRESVLQAVRSGAQHDAGSGPPFDVLLVWYSGGSRMYRYA